MIESNVLILLGNGYNRALGLRTSYADFGSLFFTHVDHVCPLKVVDGLYKV
jgi:hypothetical protein